MPGQKVSPTASRCEWCTRTPVARAIDTSSAVASINVSDDPRTWAVNSPSASATIAAKPVSSPVSLNIPGG